MPAGVTDADLGEPQCQRPEFPPDAGMTAQFVRIEREHFFGGHVMTATNKDPLTVAAEHLKETLAMPRQGSERAWLDSLRHALTQLDGELFRRKAPSEAQLLKPVDQPSQQGSPGLSREVQALRDELAALSSKLNALLAEAGPASDPDAVAALNLGVQELLQAISHFQTTENHLVMETALRETGGGD